MLQKSKAAVVVLSQEVVILSFQISFKRGPESKGIGIFSSKILWANLRFPKQSVKLWVFSYSHSSQMWTMPARCSLAMYSTSSFTFITFAISTLFPSVHVLVNGSWSEYVTDGHTLRHHNPSRQGLQALSTWKTRKNLNWASAALHHKSFRV